MHTLHASLLNSLAFITSKLYLTVTSSTSCVLSKPAVFISDTELAKEVLVLRLHHKIVSNMKDQDSILALKSHHSYRNILE